MLPTDRQRMPSDGKSSHCLWQGELKIYGPSQTYKDNHFAKKKKKNCIRIANLDEK
jgi:hypothetical protein